MNTNGQPSLEVLERRVRTLSEKILKTLDGERADVGVLACLQACISIARQEAQQAGTPEDVITAIEKMEVALDAMKRAEHAAGAAGAIKVPQ